MDAIQLMEGFAKASEADWLALVDKTLNGKPFEKALGETTLDGIRIEPLYGQTDGSPPLPGRSAGTAWQVAQRIDHPDLAKARELMMLDLEGGATALELLPEGAATAYGFGVRIDGQEALAALLKGVVLDAIGLRLEGSQLEAFRAIAGAGNVDPAAIDLDGGLDPLDPSAPGLAASLRADGFRPPLFRADGRAFHAAGASEAQELAAALAAGVAALRAMEEAGEELDSTAISFALAADADQFPTLAKFRAMRLVWAQVLAESGLDQIPARIHGETAWRMLSRRDPWVNLLRATVAVAAAGLGGADSITVLPHTCALGLPDAFARRLARNTQTILAEESGLFRGTDPAAGSGYVEALTGSLASAAWDLFREIETEGGLKASLEAGAIQQRVADSRNRRMAAVARRKSPLTGVSEFPHLAEGPVAVLCERDAGTALVEPHPGLAPVRMATAYENLRDRSDAHLDRHNARPQVFLANLGSVAAFTARAMWARNAFEAGGIEALTNTGFDDSAGAGKAFAASGARVACICSSDAVYAEQAQAAASALKDAGASHVWLAGRPGDAEASLREAGVDAFIYAGCDMIDVLEDAFERAGVAA